MSQLKIICDNREPPEIISNLEEMGVQVESKQLEIGDYIVSENVGIERKSGNDFVASLADGRLFEQVDRLQNAYPRPIYILENFSSAFEREGWEERRKHVYGALCYISVRRGIPVTPTESLEETSLLLERIVSWEQEEHD
ncbi:MAG: ERCC4 domain-containing protein, partial [Candidatus Heimdallarchaeota archaeon]